MKTTNTDEFYKLENILDVIGLDHYFTEEKTFVIHTPEERDYNLVDTLLTDYVDIGEWYSGADEDFIEIPEEWIPEEILTELYNNEQKES